MSIKDMSNEEIVEMILEGFEEDGRVRTAFMRVECHDGRPVISGRVGSDKEMQILDEIMTDVLDIHDYETHVWVDDTLAFGEAEEGGEESEEFLVEEESDLDDDSFGSDDDEEK